MPKRANLSFDEISCHSMDGAIVPFPDDPDDLTLPDAHEDPNNPFSLPRSLALEHGPAAITACDVEQALLWLILTHPETIALVLDEGLSPEHFAFPYHLEAFSWAAAAQACGMPVTFEACALSMADRHPAFFWFDWMHGLLFCEGSYELEAPAEEAVRHAQWIIELAWERQEALEPPTDAVAAALLFAGYDEDNTPTSLPGLVREAIGLIEARPHLIEALKEACEDRLPPSRRANPRFLDAERRAAAALARLELRCEEIRSAMDFLADDVFDLANLARLAELLQPAPRRWKS